MRNKTPILWIVIPCYNEEAVLPITAPLFLGELNELIGKQKVAEDSRILFIDDGSKDNTWELIKNLSKENETIIGIRQSRNRGHQNAVFAGLMEAKSYADITISIDCDGQDDITAMEEMVDAYMDGCEVVYGVRKDRSSDTAFKKRTAEGYYKFLQKMGVDIVYNHADYRLIGRVALEAFADFTETDLFLRGLVPLIGFKSTNVYYDRHERMAGGSHYSLKKMLYLAGSGIIGFSEKPVELMLLAGCGIASLGFLGLLISLIMAIAGAASAGFLAIFSLIMALGGIQLFAIGVATAYASKALKEAKDRPRYIISERTWEPTL